MKKFIALLPLFLISISVQAQALDTDAEVSLQELESWIEEAESEMAQTRNFQKADTTKYQSRWGRRQAMFHSLRGTASETKESSRPAFSLRKSRRTRMDNTNISTQRKTRTTGRSAYGASSNKARLQTRKNNSRFQAKPQRFKSRVQKRAQSSMFENQNSTLKNILSEIEADFEFEIEVDQN